MNSCIKSRKNKEAVANARTTTVPVEGAIAAFHFEVKLGPCRSVLRIVLRYIIINSVYIVSLYTIIFLELPTRAHLFCMYLLIPIDILLHE